MQNRGAGNGIMMPSWMARWLINAFALLIVAHIPYGSGNLIKIEGVGAALISAAVLGLINTFIKPIFILLSLPAQILTFGLFTLVINAVILLMADWLLGSALDLPGGLFAAIVASVVLSLTGAALNAVIRGDRK
ncbi:MAG: phage holin family protein [Bacillota bacterium]|jgi:putative membrane protein|nr:phage holin family protein [Bacillota bacterium]